MILHPLPPLPPIRDSNIISENTVRDDFSSLPDTAMSFPACINIFFSSSSGIYAIQNKGESDGLLSRGTRGQKTLFLLRLRNSLIPLLPNSTFFRWAFQSCPANPHFGQTDTAAEAMVSRSKGTWRGQLLKTFLRSQIEMRSWEREYSLLKLLSKAYFWGICITDGCFFHWWLILGYIHAALIQGVS